MILQSTGELLYKPQRVVSLVPSQTELLHYLGSEEIVAGITKFCVHPKEWLSTKMIVGGTKNIHYTRVKNCNPDLVIANKEENVKDQIEILAKEYPVWVTDVNDLEDALQMIKDIGQLIHTGDKAADLVHELKTAFVGLQKPTRKIKTCYLIWQKPYMTIGGDTFINDMLNKCGLQNIFADCNRYPEVNISQLPSMDCELLLLSSEPYPFKQKYLEALQLQLPGMKIMLVDGEMFSWYGSRLLLAPGYFARILQELDRK